jgi:hypothetical protein
MGFLSDRPQATFGVLVLHRDRIRKLDEKKPGREQPLDGATARVEAGEALEKRVTATRLATLGIFALAAKKKSGGESFLTVEGPEFFWSVEVGRGDQGKAREFAAKVNSAAKALDAP